MRAPSPFRKRDLTAAVQAVRAAGVEVERVELDPLGKIVVVTRKAGGASSPTDDDLDRELAEFEARHERTANLDLAETGDVPRDVAARRMGTTLARFNKVLPNLISRGFPGPDPDTGNFDLDAIDQWRRLRTPNLFDADNASD